MDMSSNPSQAQKVTQSTTNKLMADLIWELRMHDVKPKYCDTL